MSQEITSTEKFLRILKKHVAEGDGQDQGHVLVIKYYFDWCGFCQKVKPAYEALAKMMKPHGNVQFLSINIEKNPELAQLFGVSAGPTFIIMNSDERVERVEGANIDAVADAIQRMLT